MQSNGEAKNGSLLPKSANQTESMASSRQSATLVRVRDLETEASEASNQQTSTTVTLSVQTQGRSSTVDNQVVESSSNINPETSNTGINLNQPSENIDPPPPYPGPPLHPVGTNNQPTLPAVNDLPPRYDNNSPREHRGNQNSESQVILVPCRLNQHGQLIPVQLHVPEHSEQSLHNDVTTGSLRDIQVNFISQQPRNDIHVTRPSALSASRTTNLQPLPSTSTIANHRSSHSRRTAQQTRTHRQPSYSARSTEHVHIVGAHRKPPNNPIFIWLSTACLILCCFTANTFALLCVFPALFYSLKAEEHNNQGNYLRAKRYRLASFLCNALALIDYIIFLVIAIVVTLIYLYG